MASYHSRSSRARLILKPGHFLHSLGPGILFAATSVGVSHLVQSTRAGATFGLGLILVVMLAHAVKYSAFRAGSDYAAATGNTLLDAYKQQGNWALLLYAGVTLSSMFVGLAAVTLVCAGLFKEVIGVGGSSSVIATAIVFISALLLIQGQYQWLENITKLLIALLTIITVVTTVLALPALDWQYSAVWFPQEWDIKTLLFVTALAGWMPTALDTSVWQSLWCVEKRRKNVQFSYAQSRRDFSVGFCTTLLLAICFLLIGASIMHGSGKIFSATASGFATQFIDMYAQTLGQWSRPLIGMTALAVMFSTVLTLLDGFPRACAKWLIIVQQPQWLSEQQRVANEQHWYNRLLIAQSVVALCIIYFWLSSFKLLVDIAATISFVTAPVLALLNHRAINSNEVPKQYRLKGLNYRLSIISIVCLSIFSLGYLYLLLV